MSNLDICSILVAMLEEADPMAMAKTPIEIDQEALATAAEVLGTTTKKDTVNAALREVGQRLVRLRALARLGEMADRGDFDEFLGDRSAYRR
jgi:Arc/MetJ family transcription regulator